MPSRCALFAFLLGIGLSGTPTYAHHSVSAEFDLSHRVALQGRVTKIDWKNPHVYLYVDVNAGGRRTIGPVRRPVRTRWRGKAGAGGRSRLETR